MAIVGRRRSASTRQTLKPASASVEARLIATVVLPSPGIGAGDRDDPRVLVDVGELQVRAQLAEVLGAHVARAGPGRDRVALASSGPRRRRPSSVRGDTFARVSASLIRVSRMSRATASAAPTSRPRITPRAMLRTALGDAGLRRGGGGPGDEQVDRVAVRGGGVALDGLGQPGRGRVGDRGGLAGRTVLGMHQDDCLAGRRARAELALEAGVADLQGEIALDVLEHVGCTDDLGEGGHLVLHVQLLLRRKGRIGTAG